MTALVPERRTAMYHSQLAMGAVMAAVDGWQLPVDYGDVSQEAARLRETVGISDISPVGKLRIVGAAEAVGAIIPGLVGFAPGAVGKVDSPSDGAGGSLLAAWLTADEFLLLTPAGQAPATMDAMPDPDSICAHVVDITSGLCGVSITGPVSTRLLSRITDLDISPRVMPDLTCAQARFSEVQGLLLRRDIQSISAYQLYAGREFGEYLWETLIHAAAETGGGPVGTEALARFRSGN